MKDILFGNRYIILMLIASAISLLRGFVVAGVLDLSSFGYYATIIGIGIFASLLLSSGKTERTYKIFPRYWSEKNFSKIIDQADETAKLIILRASIVFMLLLLSFFINEFRFFSTSGLLVLFISLGTTLASLYVSAIRSTGRVTILAQNTLIRALLVATLSIFGSYTYQWQGAIIGEIFGTLLGIILTRFSVKKLIRAKTPPTENKITTTSHTMKELNGGQWVFLTLLIISAFTYLDRFFVASIFGTELVGTYGFLMLFVIASNTFTGIIIQKGGPHIIKMAHLGKSKKAQMKYFTLWLILIVITILTFLIISIIALSIGPAQSYYDKFNIDLNLLVATSLLALLQFGGFIDYLLMSRDKERLMFYSACIYTLIIIVLSTLFLSFSFTLSNLIYSLAISKFFHIVIQTRYYIKK